MTKALTKNPAAFSETAIADEIALLNVTDGTFYSLTGTAAAIWSAIDGSRDRDALVQAMAAQFGTAPDVIASDVDTFLDQLAAAGFVS